jgi:phosphoglucosamine mutase
MSNPAILKALRDLGIDYTLTDVGDKYVFKALDEENLNVGGESSGHIILNHLLHSGDGLLVSIYILYILNELQMSLHDFGYVKPYPIKTQNIKNISKSVLLKPEVLNIISEHQKEIEALGGILLVRASGTEDLIRVTLSVEDENILNDVLTHIVRTLEKEGMKS